MTFSSSSPGTPIFRGVPRRPTARTTLRAAMMPFEVWTRKAPSSPSIPLTWLFSSTFTWSFSMALPQVSRSSSFEMIFFPILPKPGMVAGSVMTIFRRG